MISFIWSAKYPFLSGAGGSENYTAGQIRELQRRNIACRIITIGFGTKDGRDDFPDIEFLALRSKEELSNLDDTLVFVTYPLAVRTKRPAYVILHCPPPQYMQGDDLFDPAGMKGKRVITPSRFALRVWSGYHAKSIANTAIVHPFADQAFAKVDRKPYQGKQVRLLFPGRLKADKGIYTLLAALHLDPMQELDYTLTVTSAGAHSPEGEVIAKLLKAHPNVSLVPARRTPAAMAKLMAEHDIVLIPSTNIFWKETFGMASVEAQHAGCRVVGSKAGGLPETDCGMLLLTKPDDPLALAKGINEAVALGPVTEYERAKASRKFTVSQSVDSLLRAMRLDGQTPSIRLLHEPLRQLPNLASQFSPFGPRLK
jgi:D-inositol-3-phosphate glycosyltransferase